MIFFRAKVNGFQPITPNFKAFRNIFIKSRSFSERLSAKFGRLQIIKFQKLVTTLDQLDPVLPTE
jgi:hypothetical protein